MLKLAIIASFFLLTSGFLLHSPDEQDNDVEKDYLPNIKVITIGIPDPIWVLSLTDESLGFEKLRVASRTEEEVFNRVVRPLIRSFRRRPPIRVKKDDPAINESQLTAMRHHQDQDNDDIKLEIIRIINKFAMSTLTEPDSYLPESEQEEGLSLNLYFKGPYTSLMVTSGRKQWNYFISPPSPLPAWFYERHVNIQENNGEKYATIPETVRNDFYTKILHMLQMFLGFPV